MKTLPIVAKWIHRASTDKAIKEVLGVQDQSYSWDGFNEHGRNLLRNAKDEPSRKLDASLDTLQKQINRMHREGAKARAINDIYQRGVYTAELQYHKAMAEFVGGCQYRLDELEADYKDKRYRSSSAARGLFEAQELQTAISAMSKERLQEHLGEMSQNFGKYDPNEINTVLAEAKKQGIETSGYDAELERTNALTPWQNTEEGRGLVKAISERSSMADNMAWVPVDADGQRAMQPVKISNLIDLNPPSETGGDLDNSEM